MKRKRYINITDGVVKIVTTEQYNKAVSEISSLSKRIFDIMEENAIEEINLGIYPYKLIKYRKVKIIRLIYKLANWSSWQDT